jgi:hypothetical protein
LIFLLLQKLYRECQPRKRGYLDKAKEGLVVERESGCRSVEGVGIGGGGGGGGEGVEVSYDVPC